jgi:stage III sporulation protein SpoIIIAA
MVPRREQQADILVQAVQNHNPDVIIVDEIGTKQVRGLGGMSKLQKAMHTVTDSHACWLTFCGRVQPD